MDRKLLSIVLASSALLSSQLAAADFQLEFPWCPDKPYYFRNVEEATFAVIVGLEFPVSPEAYGVRGWSLGLTVEGATIDEALTFGDPANPAESNGLNLEVQTIYDDDGDPTTPPLNSYTLNLLDASSRSIEPATLPGDPTLPGLISTVLLDGSNRMALQPDNYPFLCFLYLKVRLPATVTLRLVDGLQGSSGPATNLIQLDSGPVAPRLSECRLEVQEDPRRFFLSLVPEDGEAGPLQEDGFRVVEKTLPTGVYTFPCLVQVASEGLLFRWGVQGWSLSICHDPCLSYGVVRDAGGKIVPPVSMDGLHVSTIYDDDGKPSTPPLDPYDFDLKDSSFKLAKPAHGGGCSEFPEEIQGAVAAAVLNFQTNMTLQPNSSAAILRLVYQLHVGPGQNPDCKVRFLDGLVADTSCPIENVVTYDGASFHPDRMDGLAFRLTGIELPFRRGDANADGGMDVSDAVVILGYLFLSEPSEIGCWRSADIDDSGALDIADGVSLLEHLFRGSFEVPPPHESCGLDDSADTLGCTSFAPCR